MQRQIRNQHRVQAEQQRMQQQQRQTQRQARREERQQQVGVAAPPQGPVLVLDLDEQEGAELGQVFGNLQVGLPVGLRCPDSAPCSR